MPIQDWCAGGRTMKSHIRVGGTLRRNVSIALVIAAAFSMPAAAQTLEEIIVTAQKRAESAQDVPIAITALDAAVLERNQIENVGDLSSLVPNLQFGNFSSTATAASSSLAISTQMALPVQHW